MNEGITEIRPATTDEQIAQWARRQAALLKELMEPLTVDDMEFENISYGRQPEAHVHGMNTLRAIAKATGCAWRITDRHDEMYPWRMEVIIDGITLYAIGRDEDLTLDELKHMREDELKHMKEQEA